MSTSRIVLNLEILRDGRISLVFDESPDIDDALCSPLALDLPVTLVADALCDAVADDLQTRLRAVADEARQSLRLRAI